jgi:hypothetical protein
VSRRIEPVPAFRKSLAALPRIPEVRAVVHALIERIIARPEEAAVLAETNARAVYSRHTPWHPALRLYYSIDATTIYLLHVEEFDELLLNQD